MWWTGSLALLVAAAAAVGSDGWTPSVAGCLDTEKPSPDAPAVRTASSCASLSHRLHSMEAARRAARFYGEENQPRRAREVLSPFEGVGDAETLYLLASYDSRLDNKELAVGEYRRALAAAEHVADGSLRAKVMNHLGYELYRSSEYEEAVRMLDGLLHDRRGALSITLERDTRLRLARALNEMGDAPAAAAELQRLRDVLGTTPLSARELLLDARLHLNSGQLRSADALLEQTQAAARQEGDRLTELSALTDRIEVAVREKEWQRMSALLAERQSFQDVFDLDAERELDTYQGLAARAQGRDEEAGKWLQRALTMSPPRTERWELQYELGRSLQALGRQDEAKLAFEASIAEVESQREALLDPGQQATLAQSREKPYEALFELFAGTQASESALRTLQRSLAGRLDDEVAQAASVTGQAPGDALGRSVARRSLAEASRDLPERELSTEDAGARFVAFVTTDVHSWRVLQSAGRTRIEQLALPPKEFCALMQKFADDFEDEVGRRLGAALFPSATLELLGPRFAILLPACARGFPVAALRIGEDRLVDRAVVSLAPDVSTITWPGRKEQPDGAPRDLILADPLGNLPYARAEGEWTGRFTGADVRLGLRASGAALEPSGERLLHFATHTAVDVAGPALVLADRKISVTDILRQRLHADVVVLASCHSGSRLEATAAETLSTAFLRAGSGAVLATLRSVEDGFAFEVVRAFYEQGGLDDPAGALARVQRHLAQREPPARWSAFFVAGTAQLLTRASASGRPLAQAPGASAK